MSRVSNEDLELIIAGGHLGAGTDIPIARELRAAREALTKFGLAHKKGCAAILWAERFNKLKDHLQRQAWRKVRKECDCGRLKALAELDALEDGK